MYKGIGSIKGLGFHSVVFRIGAILVLLVLFSTGLSSGLGYSELARETKENAQVRIDRAARTAVALLRFGLNHSVDADYYADGSPAALRMTDRNFSALGPTDEVNQLLKTIGNANSGAANLFRWSDETQSFKRFATTFTRPDGSPAPEFSISASHPAFADLVKGVPFTGEVPVQGRFRLAYLTPVLNQGGQIIGAVAVDVGWADDLKAATTRLQKRMVFIMVVILTAAILFGALLLRLELRPFSQIAKAADQLAGGSFPSLKTFNERRDEIGDLSRGLQRVTDLQDKLQKLAYTDPITTAGNRTRYFLDLTSVLQTAKANGTSASLFHIDFKGFAKINDTFGQQIGNRILLQAFARLAAIFGAKAQISRMSGDNFCIVLPLESSQSVTKSYALKAIDALSAPFHVNENEIRVEPKVGIALLPMDASDAETAHRVAGLALRSARDSDDKMYEFFSAPLNERIQDEMQTEALLRTALERKKLKLHYQPQFDPRDRKLIGLEALVRWQDKDKGFIPPSEFIPIAEKTGLILDLGHYVLEEACKQAATWLHTGVAFGHVSVNVSPIQFRQPSFAETVKSCLKFYSLPANLLCLEVTENVFVDTSEQMVLDILSELDAVGVQLSLDDFGSGYSSLIYLHSLPFRELKIDRSFLFNADQNPQKQHLFEAIVGLGKSLGLRVIAEGAESAGEVALAASQDCDAVQGYYYCPPVTPEDLPLRLAQQMQQISAPEPALRARCRA